MPGEIIDQRLPGGPNPSAADSLLSNRGTVINIQSNTRGADFLRRGSLSMHVLRRAVHNAANRRALAADDSLLAWSVQDARRQCERAGRR